MTFDAHETAAAEEHDSAAAVALEAVRVIDAADATTAELWNPRQLLRRWVGISGPYNMARMVPEMHRRGLPACAIRGLLDGDAAQCSPVCLCDALDAETCERAMPPVFLYHGRADKTASVAHCDDLERTLRRRGVPVESVIYEKFTHTDPILEGPVSGSDPLMVALLELIHDRRSVLGPLATGGTAKQGSSSIMPMSMPLKKPLSAFQISPLVPRALVSCARWINPF